MNGRRVQGPVRGTARRIRYPWPAAQAGAIRRGLHGGAVMTYPTETAYALGGNALDPAVVDAVYRLKGRGREKALLLLVDGANGPDPWAAEVGSAARRLMARFWPGPLTLVFRAGPAVPAHLTDARGTVALRWSPHPLLAELARLGGVPLIGTSANVSGEPSLYTVDEVLAALPRGIDIAFDGGRASGGPPSSLVDTTVTPCRLLREGVLSRAELEAALGEPLS